MIESKSNARPHLVPVRKILSVRGVERNVEEGRGKVKDTVIDEIEGVDIGRIIDDAIIHVECGGLTPRSANQQQTEKS